jgi:uncharacterized protein YkwD
LSIPDGEIEMQILAGTLLMQALAVAAPSDEGAQQARQIAKQVAKPVASLKLNVVESQILKHTNATRAKYGRPPLTVDPHLVRSARRHAIWMTRNRSLRHTSAAVAENIAMGQHSASQVVQDWMNSPGHRANMLDPGHRRMGMSAYRTPNGTVFWCQQFLR